MEAEAGLVELDADADLVAAAAAAGGFAAAVAAAAAAAAADSTSAAPAAIGEPSVTNLRMFSSFVWSAVRQRWAQCVSAVQWVEDLATGSPWRGRSADW